jgi:GDP-L-fucose synthase
MYLVVGADGFLGRNMCELFAREGIAHYPIRRADADLRELEETRRAFAEAPEATRIFHCVTYQRTGAVQYELQGELLMNNALMHTNVLTCWREYQPQAKLVAMGSSCTYPESDDPLPESMFGTGDTHPSVRGYAFAKKMLALGCELHAQQYGMKYLYCVLATLYGPYDHVEQDRSHFIGALMHRAVQEMREGKPEFSLWGKPDVVRECLHVEDQIRAILAADAAFSNQVLNCAANTPVTVDEVAQAVKQAIGWNVPSHYVPGSFVGTSRKTLDSSLFLQKTGWKPRYSLAEGLSQLYKREYQSN